MATVAESANQSQLNAAIEGGVDTLAQLQKVTFQKYIRLVLPLDGFVFWVKADLVSASAAFNASAFNTYPLNASDVLGEDAAGAAIGDFVIGLSSVGVQPAPPTPEPYKALQVEVQGSLHYTTDRRQNVDETIAVNRMILTSEQEIQPFNTISPNVLFVGEFEGVRFAFSRRGSFYRQAAMYHYEGDAVYPALASQLIDSLAAFNARELVVSNSLPLWLGLDAYMPIYPSFAVPDNVLPPYASVHIAPENTEALAAAPTIDFRSSHVQLTKDRVELAIYGLRNNAALDFVDYVNQFSLDSDLFGIMNMPVLRDEKRTQPEITALAMKKSIIYEVNYYQQRITDLARQLIRKSVPSFVVQ